MLPRLLLLLVGLAVCPASWAAITLPPPTSIPTTTTPLPPPTSEPATSAPSSCALANGSNASAACDILPALANGSILPRNLTRDSTMTISGMARLLQSDSGEVRIQSNMSVFTDTAVDCPTLENADALSQAELIARLTHPCRFDRTLRPYVVDEATGLATEDPVQVYVRMYIDVLQVGDASYLQFQLQGNIQVRYVDPRLAFEQYAPLRHQQIIGDASLRHAIWIPHIMLANEYSSNVLGTHEQNILTSISGDGTVVVGSRVQANLYCWMQLRRFPFDEQDCTSDLESWMYNTSQMVMHWEQISPVLIDANMHLTQYELQRGWTNESVIDTDMEDLRRGAFVGQYSHLGFTVRLVRQSGHWLLAYFLPSMIIVGVSWTAFWLQPDATPSRSTLGTTTMMTFVTLSVGQANSLPRVSYIKFTEIWFFACALFIGASLIEFGFVNTIWRRRRPIKLRRLRGLNILYVAVTPKRNQKQEKPPGRIPPPGATVDKYLNIETPPVATPGTSNDQPPPPEKLDDNDPDTWASISPHDAALWVDRKARFAFPFCFICFNIIFWSIVYFS